MERGYEVTSDLWELGLIVAHLSISLLANEVPHSPVLIRGNRAVDTSSCYKYIQFYLCEEKSRIYSSTAFVLGEVRILGYNIY